MTSGLFRTFGDDEPRSEEYLDRVGREIEKPYCVIDGFNNEKYRDLTTKDNIQARDVFYNPDWEVGGPWYLIEDGHDAIGHEYIPGKMKIIRRPVE